MDFQQEQICTKCGQSKSLDEFRTNSTKAAGRQSQCKACEYLYHLDYKEKPKKVIEEKTCGKCGLLQSLDQFTKDVHSPDGKKYTCKTCVAAIDAARRDMPKVVPDEKQCRKCKLVKAIVEFPSNISRKDGHDSRCKSCKSSENIIYRERNGDKARAATRRWMAAHSDRSNLSWHNREARRRALPNTWTPEQVAFMLNYWQYACAICSNEQGFFWLLAKDHWIPLASPTCPGTVASNMIPLCHGDGGCNNSKGDRDPHTWLVWRFGTKKAATIERKIAVYFALVAQMFGHQVHNHSSKQPNQTHHQTLR